jgi:diadenosine tetraphosphate (Ap4A) HIT family hydrolase
MTVRRPFDLQSYERRSQQGPCFICEILAGNPAYEHHVIYEDDIALVFLNKYPTLYGYTLVVPKRHVERVTADFTPKEYLALQSVVYRVAQAIQRVVPAERLYILSLGSQQGNRHVHWHLAPLPPGVPYEEQQLAALDVRKGVLDMSEAEKAGLAALIRAAMDAQQS